MYYLHISVMTFGLMQGATGASFVSFYPFIKRVGTLSATNNNNNVNTPFCSTIHRYLLDYNVSRRTFMFTSAAAMSPLLQAGALPTNLEKNNSFEKSGDGDEENDPIRIAIIGGGIAGVTAASSLATRLQSNQNVQIVVFEANANANAVQQQPLWPAATARNANTIVPGVSMHVMAKRSTLSKIFQDTTKDWISTQTQSFRSTFLSKDDDKSLLKNIDNFDIVPPYFSINLLKCMGPQVPSEERWTFLTFLRQFLSTSLLSDAKQAEERGSHVLQLAKANRFLLLNDFDKMGSEKLLGVAKGFVSLHRTKQSADHAVQEAKEHGEPANLLSPKEAITLEPHIKNLPMSPLYAVHRPNDYSANCLAYVQNLKDRCKRVGVQFMEQQEGRVQSIERVNANQGTDQISNYLPTKLSFASPDAEGNKQQTSRFRINVADGKSYEADYLVLAAGVNTPLFARQVNAGKFCPTYPLRGYSLTLHTQNEDNSEIKKKNLLTCPISIDSMYISSVGPNMARLAGYGELVGYRDGAVHVPSVAPRVLARYGRTIFPETATSVASDAAIQCFRPMSPDDLPLVGKVSAVPGLFLHSGHGTLGWTMSLATAECVAQAVCDEIEGVENADKFDLPDKTTIPRSVISPDRFA